MGSARTKTSRARDTRFLAVISFYSGLLPGKSLEPWQRDIERVNDHEFGRQYEYPQVPQRQAGGLAEDLARQKPG